jgi:alpha-amylase
MNTSTYQEATSQTSRYAASIDGSKGKLLVVVGTTTGYAADDSWVNIINDSRYQYYLSKSTETAWADKASGTYEEAFGVKLTAVSADNGAQLVYTTNGEDPTSSSTKVNSGSTINITESCTLKVGLLVGGVVKSIITRQYVIKPFEPHKATVYVKKATGWDNMHFYVWANDGKNTQLNGGWPGNQVTATKEIQGIVWYYKAFDVNTKDYSFNVIFDKGSSDDQTVDIGPISEDTYFEISATKTSGKFTVTNVTQEIITGIEAIRTTPSTKDNVIYDLQGRKVSKEQLKKGLYIVNGKKVVIK